MGTGGTKGYRSAGFTTGIISTLPSRTVTCEKVLYTNELYLKYNICTNPND